MSQQADTVVVDSTSFNVSRVSHQMRPPLVSRLVIYPMNISVNEIIEVNCTEVYATVNEMASTTINIVGNTRSSKYSIKPF